MYNMLLLNFRVWTYDWEFLKLHMFIFVKTAKFNE